MIRFTAALLAIALALPTPATALSCVRPDVRRAYQNAEKSADTYIIALGRLEFNAARLPKTTPKGQKHVFVPARLKARSVTRTGYSSWIDQKIRLRVTCVSAWCGSATPNIDTLLFLRQTPLGYVLDLGPCPTNAFANPSSTQLKQLRSCMSKGPCKPNRR